MNRCRWSILLVVIFAACPALGRTWTDTSGQKVEGDFIRLSRGRVVIKVSGQFVQVPFGRLVPEDQEFVRDKLEKQGQGNLLPPRKKPAQNTPAQSNTTEKNKPAENKPAAEQNPKLGEERTWTDVKGSKVLARLVGIEGGKVVLRYDGKDKSFAFEKFSRADQEYVRTEMVARGEGFKVPKLAEPVNVHPTPAPTEIVQVPPTPTTQKPDTPKPITKLNNPQPPKPETDNPKPPPVPVHPPEIAVESHPPESKSPAPASLSAVAPSPSPPKATPLVGAAPAPTSTASSSESAAPPAKSRVCSNCRFKLPDTCKPGDYCPNCKTYLHYEVTDQGQRVSAPFAFSTVGIPAGIASLVYAVAVAIVWIGRQSQNKRPGLLVKRAPSQGS